MQPTKEHPEKIRKKRIEQHIKDVKFSEQITVQVSSSKPRKPLRINYVIKDLPLY